jgi:ABC-type nitrate/sulfonate/bicarbonate transport system ATPase subunit
MIIPACAAMLNGIWQKEPRSFVTPAIQSFCWRIEQQIGEGGFALTIGDPGTGKSAALRILVERLGNLADVMVGVLTRPQSRSTGPRHRIGTPWFRPGRDRSG